MGNSQERDETSTSKGNRVMRDRRRRRSTLERRHPRNRLSVEGIFKKLTSPAITGSPVVVEEDFAISSSTYFCKERKCELWTRFDAREIDSTGMKSDIIVMFDFVKSNSIRVEYVKFKRTKMFRFDELKSVDVNGNLSVGVKFKSPVTMALIDMLDHQPEPPTTWSFDSHRHLFQFLKSVGSAFRTEENVLRRFVVWLCLSDAYIPAMLKWKHRKPTSEGGLIQIGSLNKRLKFRFAMRDREFRSIEYVRPCDSGFEKELPEQLKKCPLAALTFARDESRFVLKLLFQNVNELDAFIGHIRNVIISSADDRDHLFQIKGPRERWRRRGAIIMLRVLLNRYYRNDDDLLMRWYDDACPLLEVKSDHDREVKFKYALGWLLACCRESHFRHVLRFL